MTLLWTILALFVYPGRAREHILTLWVFVFLILPKFFNRSYVRAKFGEFLSLFWDEMLCLKCQQNNNNYIQDIYNRLLFLQESMIYRFSLPKEIR